MANDSIREDVLFQSEPVTMIYPTLMAARAFSKKEGEKKYFSMSLGLRPGHPDMGPFWQACVSVAQRTWPSLGITADAVHPDVIWPFKAGEQYANERDEKDRKAALIDSAFKPRDFSAFRPFGYIISAKTGETMPPALGVKMPQGPIDVTPLNRKEHEAKFYGGGLAEVKLTVTAFTGADSKLFVLAYLSVVMAVPGGTANTAFGGGSGGNQSASSMLGYKGHASSVSPSGHPMAPGGVGIAPPMGVPAQPRGAW